MTKKDVEKLGKVGAGVIPGLEEVLTHTLAFLVSWVKHRTIQQKRENEEGQEEEVRRFIETRATEVWVVSGTLKRFFKAFYRS